MQLIAEPTVRTVAGNNTLIFLPVKTECLCNCMQAVATGEVSFNFVPPSAVIHSYGS
jgi:hypothetical protein